MADETRSDKHYSLRSARNIITFINELRKHFALPAFEQEFETEREWGKLESDAVSIHVLHAFDYNTLHRSAPKKYPKGSNYAVHVQVKNGAPVKWTEAWIQDKWLPRWQEKLTELAEDKRVFVDGKWRDK